MDEEPLGTSKPPLLRLDLPVADSVERSRSQSLPQPRISTPPRSPPRSPSPPRNFGPVGLPNKAREELQKLLAHLLSWLKTRPKAPSVYEELSADASKKVSNPLGVVLQSVKTAVQIKGTRELSNTYTRGWISEEQVTVETEQVFSTDVSYDYMIQLRDVLILSDRRGWQILHPADVEVATASQREGSSRRLRRANPQPGQRLRSLSFEAHSGSPDLLLECIDVLASMISEDCRFKASSPRLSRPPYGLQAACLDVAQILIRTYHHDAKILSQIGYSVIPAFASFDPCLHTRLLGFFEDGILRGMLEDLQLMQGKDIPRERGFSSIPGPVGQLENPIVAIHIDEAVDDDRSAKAGQQGWLQGASSPTAASTVLSTVAPSQSLTMYHLSSLIPPLLAAILDAIDPFESDARDIPKLHRFNTLLLTIISMKWDAYLDVLEVVAYHGPQSRRRALAVLATFWPKALGHITIGKSPGVISYDECLSTHTSLKPRFERRERDHLYAHEFMPWRFSSANVPSIDYGVLPNCCQSCSGPIVGFGLFCPICFVCVHKTCYDPPDGIFYGQYLSSPEADPRPYYLSFSNILPSPRDANLEIVKKAEHGFRLANIFTLTLCLVCHKPLWGYMMQGMKCITCHQLVHASCMTTDTVGFPHCQDSIVSSNFIDWSVLRESFVDHFSQIIFTVEELSKKTYEEISICYSILWTQLSILDNGINHRSIIVNRKTGKTALSKDNHLDDFELQSSVRLYEEYLSSGKLVMSAALREYHDFNKHAASNEHSILFDWPLLANITSIVKTSSPPHLSPLSAPSNLLNVADRDIEAITDTTSRSYEVASLSYVQNNLRQEFQVYSDRVAEYLLSHIQQVGLFDHVKAKSGMPEGTVPSKSLCYFPLPLGLDLSSSVETLVVSIEACLRDLDIAINEYGFLLLVRRFAPTGAASEYALTRLIKIVLSWILAEDDTLMVLARDHVADNLSLPGVRSESDPSSWPSAPAGYYSTKTAVNSGGEYVSCRKQLLKRHALPWLASVHDLDVALYTNCIFDHCMDVASESHSIATSLHVPDTESKLKLESISACGEAMLRLIIKLLQTNAIFSTFAPVLIRWFDFVSPSGIVVKSLPRLFNREADHSRRASIQNDVSFVLAESVSVDPWKVIIDVASQGPSGLERTLQWLRVMARSAVDIPMQILKQLLGLADDCHATFATTVLLLESAMTTTWLKLSRSEGLDSVIVQANVIWADKLLSRMQSKDEDEQILDFLRYSLVTCLLMYGCDRQLIASLGLINTESLRYVSQRRRTVIRNSAAPAVMEIDQRLVTILSRYVVAGSPSVCVIIAKFFATVVSESALLESHEVDQFILLNGDALTQCAWRFYDIDVPEISHIRPGFLLRLLVVDSQPLDALLYDILRAADMWQTRYQGVTQLFRIILDINNPSFAVQDRQWKTSVTHIIKCFFESLWWDDHEEIRLAVEASARSLLPAHLEAISSCWNEYLSKAPVTDRARLASFLVQLHPHFPSWQVLSWETIVECLYDGFAPNEGAIENGYGPVAPQPVDASAGEQESSRPRDDPAIAALRVSLIILSLQMITDRVEIDLVNLSKVKFILVQMLGFKTISLKLAGNGQGFNVQFDDLDKLHEISHSCIGPLMRVLDASHHLPLSSSSIGVIWQEVPVPGLVGDAFVDVIAKLWDNALNLNALPYAVLRGLLESMIIIIEKHELNSPSFKHLDEVICRAVKNVTDAILLDTSYDIRHLCLAAMFAFMRGYPVLALKILGHQVQVLTRLSAALGFNTEDSIVSQAREFLVMAFIQYEVTGLFWLLSKQGRMSDDLFVMIRDVVNSPNAQAVAQGESLRDSIVRDTLSKIAASLNDRTIPDVLHNLERYVALCHHQSLPANLIQHIGLRVTAIARQTADLTVQSSSRGAPVFDPNPLLLMAATIAQHNKLHGVDLLLHTETLLRTALVRFDVNFDTLNRIFHVNSTMYRRSKTANVNGAEIPTNHIAMGVLDVLSDALKGKVRPLPSTLATTIRVVLSLHNDEDSYLPTPVLLRVSADAVTYLSYPGNRETYGPADFTASLAVAKLILHASGYADTSLGQSLGGDSRTPAPVRVWNLITLAGLESPNPETAQKVLALLPHFVAVYVSSLRSPNFGTSNEAVAPNVNHAFASVKLWMLLARKASSPTSAQATEPGYVDSDNAERMIWNELWPPFERLLVQSLPADQSAEIPPVLTFIRSCIADLVLFLRQARSVIALDTSSHMTILNTIRTSTRDEVALGKQLVRAQRSISEAPTEIPFEALKKQVSGDVLAAEKLQAMETYKQSGLDKRREYMERGRAAARDLWTTT